MEQFNLDKWLQDKSRKIRTRDGRPVRIICWDAKKSTPIIALLTTTDGEEHVFSYSEKGRIAIDEPLLDLLFADEEEELTEFEKEFEMMMVSFSNGNLGSDVIKEMPKQKLHNYARRLLDLARKETLKEQDNCVIIPEEELTEFEKELGLYIYFPKLSCEFNKDEKKYIRNAANTLFDLARKKLEPELDKKLKEAYNQGGLDTQEEITKCLPKWKNVSGKNGAGTKDYKIVGYYLVKGNYAIYLENLEKLPKEE